MSAQSGMGKVSREKKHIPGPEGCAEKMPFWTSPSLQELADLQGVHPAADLDSIGALWPEEDDPDQMLAHILAERSSCRKQ